MPRPPRSFEPGGFYHLTTRGNNGGDIVRDAHDCEAFVRVLSRAAARFPIDVRAWCLMTNHYHVVVEAKSGEVSPAMHYLSGTYARRFNERHCRTGHVFGARFRVTVLVGEDHFENACEYVIQNPVRAGIVTSSEEWPWSSAVGSTA